MKRYLRARAARLFAIAFLLTSSQSAVADEPQDYTNLQAAVANFLALVTDKTDRDGNRKIGPRGGDFDRIFGKDHPSLVEWDIIIVDPTMPRSKINAYVSNAAERTKIYFMPGRYFVEGGGKISVRNKRNLILEGPGAVLVAGENANGVEINDSSGIAVLGLGIERASLCVRLGPFPQPVERVLVRDVHCTSVDGGINASTTPVRNSIFRRNIINGLGVSTEGFLLGSTNGLNPTTGSLIEGNIVFNQDLNGLILRPGASDNIIRNNYFWFINAGPGILYGGAPDTEGAPGNLLSSNHIEQGVQLNGGGIAIKNNVLTPSAHTRISSIGLAVRPPLRQGIINGRVLIENNTVFGHHTGLYTDYNGSEIVRIANNVFYGSRGLGSADVDYFGYNPSAITWERNLYERSIFGVSAAQGFVQGRSAHEEFVRANMDELDLYPQAESTMIDFDRQSRRVLHDIDGIQRDAAIDAGAFEYRKQGSPYQDLRRLLRIALATIIAG